MPGPRSNLKRPLGDTGDCSSSSNNNNNNPKRRRPNRVRAPSPPRGPPAQSFVSKVASWLGEAMGRPFRAGAPAPRPANAPRTPAQMALMQGLERHPGGSLALYGAQPAASSRNTGISQAPSVISVDDSSELDPEEDRMRMLQGTKKTEARRHLNDLQAAESAMHPLVPGGSWFRSAFANGQYDPQLQQKKLQEAAAAAVAAVPASPFDAPAAGPSRSRPDVSFTRPHRRREWDRQSSPASSRSSSSSTTLRRRKSASNLRTPQQARQQQTMLHNRIEAARRNGDPNIRAMERVSEQLDREAAEKRAGPSRPARPHSADTSSAAAAADLLGNLKLDIRKPLDEALLTTPPTVSSATESKADAQFLPPRPAGKVKRYQEPKYERTPSALVEHLRREDEKVEELLREKKAEAEKAKKIKIPKKLAEDQDAIANDRLYDPHFKVQTGNAEVDARALRKLLPLDWLNDDVMNFYMELITQRAKKTGAKVHTMNTFFYQKLSEQGYAGANLKRWTKRMKLDIFGLDALLVPINIGNSHWTCAVINFGKKRIEYYDSMTDSGYRCGVFKNLRKYLEAEHQEKKGKAFDLSAWKDAYSAKTPRQNNGSDCGVFVCQTLELAARGKDLQRAGQFEFDASNMEFFRRLMVIEIASCELSNRFWAA